MFDARTLAALDPAYFDIYYADAYDVRLRSRNTGHFWHIHDTECSVPGTCVIIFHKHAARHPYHRHGKARSLRQAIKSIQSHDVFQLNGRRA